jgi:hypothetical protein
MFLISCGIRMDEHGSTARVNRLALSLLRPEAWLTAMLLYIPPPLSTQRAKMPNRSQASGVAGSHELRGGAPCGVDAAAAEHLA